MNRKEFVKSVSLMGAASMVLPKYSFAAVKGSDKIKVAVVGMGNRGRGALMNMFDADNNVELVAVGDAYSYPIESGKKVLEHEIKKRKADFKDYWKVGDNAFVGLDAIDKVVKTDADIVVLTTPPIFRPEHIRKCLENNKNIFAEKPICIDATQLRQVYSQLIPLADQKKLNVVCGTQMRYHKWIAEAVDKIRSGDIGDVLATDCFRYEGSYLTRGTYNPAWAGEMSPEQVKFQLINWLGFIWTSGDQIVEQYVHNLDIALWALGKMPYEVIGSGGRSTNLSYPLQGDRFSNIHGHLTFDGGIVMNAECRQEFGTTPFSALEIYGTKGKASLTFGKQYFYDTKGKLVWESSGDRKPELICEHEALFGAIRGGTAFNTLKACADSCYVGIAIREASYAGKRVKCEFFRKKSELSLVPADLKLDGIKKLAPVPNPVEYKLV